VKRIFVEPAKIAAQIKVCTARAVRQSKWRKSYPAANNPAEGRATPLTQLTVVFFRSLGQEGVPATFLRLHSFFKGRFISRLRHQVPPGSSGVQVIERELIPLRTITEIRARGPLISVLMPVFNTPAEILDTAIQSVLRQTYPNWELCICDDCSSSSETLDVLENYRGADWRIKIVRSPENLHIARATNLAAELATGEFVAFLDHDDLLEHDALEHVARTIKSDPEIDFLYTDEDKIDAQGNLSEPYFKPSWSPEHLLSVMYILHLMVVRKRLFLELGGLRHQFTGSQDYDLALRATAIARKVAHIPRVLYHWRKIPGSAAEAVDAKPEALRNAQRALEDFVSSRDPTATVRDGLLPGTYRVDWSLGDPDPVTLLILTGARSRRVEGRGNVLLVDNFLDSILSKSTYKNFRILVVDDNGNLPEPVRSKVLACGGTVESFPLKLPFNFSRKANFAISRVETEHFILLNDDLEVISEDWIEAMLGFARQPKIGAVGAMLLFPTGRIQHAGIVLGLEDTAAHIFYNTPATPAYGGFSHLVRNYSAVTGAALATRLSVVRDVGPFDESMAIDFNDVDFCLRLRSSGYRIVYTPHAKLFHFEGSSIPRREQTATDRVAFMERWKPYMASDPFYNPSLPRNRLDCLLEYRVPRKLEGEGYADEAAAPRALLSA
jgi:GT2 family glycosyltransferase